MSRRQRTSGAQAEWQNSVVRIKVLAFALAAAVVFAAPAWAWDQATGACFEIPEVGML